jgi:hypothetical protein
MRFRYNLCIDKELQAVSEGYDLFRKSNDKSLKDGDAYAKRIIADLRASVDDRNYLSDVIRPVPNDPHTFIVSGLDDFDQTMMDSMRETLALANITYSDTEINGRVFHVVTINGKEADDVTYFANARKAIAKEKMKSGASSVVGRIGRWIGSYLSWLGQGGFKRILWNGLLILVVFNMARSAIVNHSWSVKEDPRATELIAIMTDRKATADPAIEGEFSSSDDDTLKVTGDAFIYDNGYSTTAGIVDGKHQMLIPDDYESSYSADYEYYTYRFVGDELVLTQHRTDVKPNYQDDAWMTYTFTKD